MGNGRVGAMVFGGINAERVALNEDTLWGGYPRDTNKPGAAEHFRTAARMMMDGRYGEIEPYIEDHLTSSYTRSYLPLGDLWLDFPSTGEAVQSYERALSLDDALAVTEFERGGVLYTREAFVSNPAQAMFIRVAADHPGRTSFTLRLTSPLRHQVSSQGSRLTIKGIAPSEAAPNYVMEAADPVTYADDDERKGMRFIAAADIRAVGGTVAANGGQLSVEQADEVIITLTARTSFNGFDKRPYLNGTDETAACLADADAALSLDWEQAKADHLADHRSLMGRVSIELNGNDYIDQTTQERLERFADQPDDLAMYELAFQYGRYLLIASSREGTQPANLQGIWNKELRPPWSSNYTININTQMNYWPAESANLSETHEPLFGLIDDLRVTGAETARVHYGARGVCSHHNSDIWRLSNPVGEGRKGSACYAFWPMSFGWLCWHLWEHYKYTGDRAFLRSRALPALRDAARFFLDVMVRGDDGYLRVAPASSPENSFYFNGEACHISKSATMSNAITRETLEHYLDALSALGLSESMADEARAALPDIYPFQTGPDGRLLEYELPFEEPEVHHRHTSHLYGLHPARLITPDGTPDLARACRASLETRGDDGTGWSLGWKINHWARLRDGDHALRLLKRQLSYVRDDGKTSYSGGGGTYLNMFDAHPPFQIDGNFGACAGIAEMFVQCSGNTVFLLPALPAQWHTGVVKGLRAYGGLEVDITFSGGKLVEARIKRALPCVEAVTVRWPGGERTVAIPFGETMIIKGL
jgi:alpha-L-fucosidase 2